MASIHSNQGRFVLPNWTDFRSTVLSGECDPFSANIQVPFKTSFIFINDYIGKWERSHSVSDAADLISACIANGQVCPQAVTAATEILGGDWDLPYSLACAAHKILGHKTKQDKIAEVKTGTREIISQQINVAREQIRFLKSVVSQYNYNYIAYCELARNYANVGQIEQAHKMMNVATYLAPHSRYVVRCAVRLYSMTKDFDIAHDVLIKSSIFKQDPWLLASDVALRTYVKKPLPSLRHINNILKSTQYTPFSVSELASAIGTIELNDGNYKKCRELFRQAVRKPCSNTITQVGWIESERPDCQLHLDGISYIGAETLYWVELGKNNYTEARKAALNWFMESPYDKEALINAASVSYNYLKDYSTAISILDRGIQAHPQDLVMLNNLAYTYALNGNVRKAEEILNRVSVLKISEQNDIVCNFATQGLVAFRNNEMSKGAALYEKAMDYAIGDKNLKAKAKLNYLREQVRSGIIPLGDIPDINQLGPHNDREFEQLRKDVLLEIEKRKEKRE